MPGDRLCRCCHLREQSQENPPSKAARPGHAESNLLSGNVQARIYRQRAWEGGGERIRRQEEGQEDRESGEKGAEKERDGRDGGGKRMEKRGRNKRRGRHSRAQAAQSPGQSLTKAYSLMNLPESADLNHGKYKDPWYRGLSSQKNIETPEQPRVGTLASEQCPQSRLRAIGQQGRALGVFRGVVGQSQDTRALNRAEPGKAGNTLRPLCCFQHSVYHLTLTAAVWAGSTINFGMKMLI